MALPQTNRKKSVDPMFQLPPNETEAFVTLVTPTVLGTIGCVDGPAPTGIKEFTAV